MVKLTQAEKEYKKITLPEFDATKLLNSPFKVILFDSVYQNVDDVGRVIDTVVPEPDGLLKAVAQARVLHARKLGGTDLKFLRSALGLKAKELARHLVLTPEHISRCENGSLALSPQSEKLVRIYTFVSTLPFTSKRKEDGKKVGEMVAQLFESLNIKSVRSVDDELAFDFILGRHSDNLCPACAPANDDGAWDQSPPRHRASG